MCSGHLTNRHGLTRHFTGGFPSEQCSKLVGRYITGLYKINGVLQHILHGVGQLLCVYEVIETWL